MDNYTIYTAYDAAPFHWYNFPNEIFLNFYAQSENHYMTGSESPDKKSLPQLIGLDISQLLLR
jgi:hypothetical protein